ncbi:MAG: phosphoglycerate dehydrogenase [Bdellovibrionaceae bacterium]|nr:phosphoglycerate dehydrogenase [Pseudobdellovibrionaceae bacterium]|tara:strand:+ start:85219 stop:86139 length:921 start_codon:yes stop_codon:yes gene_type:complete
MSDVKVAVTSRSFSKNAILRTELLRNYPNAKFNDQGLSLKGDSLVQFLDGVERAIVALEPVDDALLSKLPDLKVISKYGVGVNNIDFKAIQKYDIKFSWTGGTNKVAVAELALGAILGLHRNLFAHNIEMKEKSVWKTRAGSNLEGKTVGIIGLGNIGTVLAQFLKVMNVNVLAYDIENKYDECQKLGISCVELNDLLTEADVITLHVPLDETSRYMISANQLSLMKKNAFLVNTSRGGVVREKDLYEFLLSNEEARAFFDVFEDEPAEGNVLLSLPNFFGSPHIGGSTDEAILAMGRAAIAGLDS